jgi:hypothetical protein
VEVTIEERGRSHPAGTTHATGHALTACGFQPRARSRGRGGSHKGGCCQLEECSRNDATMELQRGTEVIRTEELATSRLPGR